MVDIIEISAMVAAAGVLVGVAYYILDMRNQSKLRQTDILSRFYSKLTDRDFLEAWQRFNDFELKDYVASREKHGSVGFFTVDNQMVLKACDEVGVLLMRKLVDINLVDLLLRDQTYFVWEKAKPFIEDARKTDTMPNLGAGLEYLYNELKKREQKGVIHG
jgi:hypothetical protein